MTRAASTVLYGRLSIKSAGKIVYKTLSKRKGANHAIWSRRRSSTARGLLDDSGSEVWLPQYSSQRQRRLSFADRL